MLRDSHSKPKHIKLERQSAPPKAKMLEEMKQQAQSAAGSNVELPFGDDTQSFILTVTKDTRHGTFMWMLYRNDAFSSGLEWSHVTQDVTYIETLVSNSAPEFMLTKRSAAAPIEERQAPQDNSVRLRKGSLDGDLRNIQMANLLQSVSMGQMTGRLEIVASADTAVILFQYGKPVHATMRGAEGNEALIQIFGWEDGEFTFYDEPVNAPETVTRALTGLMMEGAAFADHLIYLKGNGFSNECYPVRARELTETQWADLIKQGVECDIRILQTIYQRIDGTHSWADISRDLSVRKTEWVPVLFNLVNVGLIRFNKTRLVETSQRTTAYQIDWTVIQAIENSMKRVDTGLHTYAALLYSLRQEFFRFEEYQLPFSLIVFGYCPKAQQEGGSAHSFIPFKASAISELREKVFKTKKKYDLLCHFGAFTFAMLLPMTVRENADRATEILAETCSGIVVTDEYAPNRIEFRAQVANIPEDCASLEEMLASIKRAMAAPG